MGRVTFVDERVASVVLVGPRDNPKAAVVVLPEPGGKVKTMPLTEALDSMHPSNLIDILAAQERAFGKSGLTPMA